MKKNTATAVLLSAAVLGSATACSGHSPASASGTSGSTAAQAGASSASAVAASSAPDAATNAVSAALQIWSTVPRGWLSPSQVPLAASLHWTGGGASTAQSGVDLLQTTPILYPCADADHGFGAFVKDSVSYATNYFTATVDVTTEDFNRVPGATQEYIVYSSVSAAKAAYQAIKQDVAGCSTTDVADVHNVPTTLTAKTTAKVDGGFAYTDILRTDQGKPAQVNGNYSADSDYHAYVVLSGNLVEVLYLTGGPAVDDSSKDSAALDTLITALH